MAYLEKKGVYTNVLMAGFGGQGLMFIGKLLAYCAMKRGLNVTWIPSYGPEMRGGTANCTVVISDEPIGSPVISAPEALIVMNNPSLEAFESKLKSGGRLFVDSSLVTRKVMRKDVEVVAVPADDIAMEVGEKKAANLVMLGAYIAKTGVISKEDVAEGLRELFGAKIQFLDVNMKALEKGIQHTKT
ncbi:MAG: 2-oxoacid:acceptor oxidoreductase family protein [Candidatus Bathyarchaeia archaeon]|jgi:2-oxoglutarate ferredoxin oxidoreductase subunit gamma|nr:2-oxoacid:acceptor oxidoreductase family protein [Candidatus Bathyarchaeota archaeon A05DMB-4]MDH7595767.1 2-oxoacid:acceptor oxidoreductase family protein [Candidatus Bathyarchaeota archaeon]